MQKLHILFNGQNFNEQFQKFDLSAFQLTRTDEKLFKSNYEMLNILQLQRSEDSIRKGMVNQEKEFNRLFIRNYYYLSEIDSLKTVPGKDTTQVVFPKDVMAASSQAERQKILETAWNSANFLTENLKQNKQNLYGMSKLVFKHQIVIHKKITFSIACFLLFFIGAPLGAIIRKGGLGMPAVVSTIFFILFWVLSLTGEKYAAEGVLPAYQGIWIAPAVLLPIGIFLTYKATVDASLLDTEAWIKIYQNIIRFLSRSKP